MDQYITVKSEQGKAYLESNSSQPFIKTTQDFLDLGVLAYTAGTNLYILKDVNFAPEFYDLGSGLAGEILQKCSNYHIRLAIVGQFAMVTSKKFRELMLESNRGMQVRFTGDLMDALAWLMRPAYITPG